MSKYSLQLFVLKQDSEKRNEQFEIVREAQEIAIVKGN
jgi:hypothetical protein